MSSENNEDVLIENNDIDIIKESDDIAKKITEILIEGNIWR